MLKRMILAGIILAAAYYGYSYYRGGFHTMPRLPEGAFPLSYTSGFRAIMVGVPDERTARRYLGYQAEVPFYLKESWSFCRPPRTDEQQGVSNFMKARDWPGERFEAVCEIEVDEKPVVRGWITSVPDV
jgi:hypothetical protein